MLRPWTWITAVLAPVLLLLCILFTCQYVLAKNKYTIAQANVETSVHRTNLNASHSSIQQSSAMSATYDAILLPSVFPSAPDSVYPNGQVVYTLRISHTSASSVSNLILTSTLSSEFIPTESFFVGASITELTTYPTYTWRIDNLDPNAQAVVYVVGILNPSQNVAGTLNSFVSLSSDHDSNPTNNSAQISLPITVPSVSLNSHTIAVNEGSGIAAIDLNLDVPNAYGYTMVDYATVDLSSSTSATSGLDYEPISGTVVISPALPGQRFFVEIFDDMIDENTENIRIVLSNPRGVSIDSADALTITIVDDDGAGVLIDPLSLNLVEGGPSQAFSVTLTSQPLAPVNIMLADGGDTIFDSNVLTFTISNWHQPQVVSVHAVDNYTDDGDRNALSVHQVSSQDPVYDNRPASDVTINIGDNDDAAVILSTTTITVAEGTSTTTDVDNVYTVVLNSEPMSPVMLTVHADEQLQADTEVVTFTVQNWNVPQTVTVEPRADSEAEGRHVGHITHSIDSLDSIYATAIVEDVTVVIEDDDRAAILLSSNSLTTIEGVDSTTYSITLASKPLHLVTISLLVSDTSVAVVPNNISFSPEDWNIPQVITISAKDDTEKKDTQVSRIEHIISSDDLMYDVLQEKDFIVRIEDNDRADISIAATEVKIREGANSSSQPSLASTNIYDITLVSQPTESVTVTIVTSELLTVTPEKLIFEPAEWDLHQTVLITVADDNIINGNRLFTITHQLTSEDPNYNINTTNEIVARVFDDDEPGVETSGNFSEIERNSTDTTEYTINLSSQPTTPVTITLSTNENLVAEPAVVVFTDENWALPKTISLTATASSAGNTRDGIVTYEVSSDDINFDSIEIDSFSIPITDPDPGIAIYLPFVDR